MDNLIFSAENKNIAKNYIQNIKKHLLKKQVLEIFYKEGNKTIAELSELTNNSVPTLTNIMVELGKENIVKNFGIGESKGGRRPAFYGINPEFGLMVAIRLSRKNTKIGVFNMQNQPIGNIIEIPHGIHTTDDVLPILKTHTDALLAELNIDYNRIIGIGITIPGLIDIRKGISYSYPQFAEQPLNELFSELFNCKVYIEHDTKAMALGELWFGLAKEKSNVLLVNIGSGIGLGQILNGSIYRGHSGFSGEFGHIQMNPEGELCYCGKIGCLETISSGTALIKKAQQLIAEGKNSLISSSKESGLQEIKLKSIINAAKLGDQFAIELLEEAGEYLAKGFSILIHLFNPEAIIIGGEMADADNLITDPIRQKLNKYAMQRLKQDTEILLSVLKERAGLVGMLPVIMANYLDEAFAS